MSKCSVVFNKPLYTCVAILDLYKLTLYEFYYHDLHIKFILPALHLLYCDTNSLVYSVACDDIYKTITPDLKAWFDTSNHALDNPQGFPHENKDCTGAMKDKYAGRIITHFVGLCSKLSAYFVANEQHCLENYRRVLGTQYQYCSRVHEVYTERITKVVSSGMDDKCYIETDRISTLPQLTINPHLGHRARTSTELEQPFTSRTPASLASNCIGTLFANQRLITYPLASSPANGGFFAARSYPSNTRPYSVTPETLHALRVGAMRRSTCVLVSPLSLPRFLTLDAQLHNPLKSEMVLRVQGRRCEGFLKVLPITLLHSFQRCFIPSSFHPTQSSGWMEPEKCGSDKDDTATCIKCSIATKRKALNCPTLSTTTRTPVLLVPVLQLTIVLLVPVLQLTIVLLVHTTPDRTLSAVLKILFSAIAAIEDFTRNPGHGARNRYWLLRSRHPWISDVTWESVFPITGIYVFDTTFTFQPAAKCKVTVSHRGALSKARQFSAFRVEAMRGFIRMFQSPLVLPLFQASDMPNSFNQAATLRGMPINMMLLCTIPLNASQRILLTPVGRMCMFTRPRKTSLSTLFLAGTGHVCRRGVTLAGGGGESDGGGGESALTMSLTGKSVLTNILAIDDRCTTASIGTVKSATGRLDNCTACFDITNDGDIQTGSVLMIATCLPAGVTEKFAVLRDVEVSGGEVGTCCKAGCWLQEARREGGKCVVRGSALSPRGVLKSSSRLLTQ
ncbi:hypothetical protein PR048_005959 [Dryococelus australis]|uniref:Uncharacterized protein n=1 Tax=Dryococelus australis TaxID=614101 RepID=A0ABQ9I9N5_9NEOP|nr:hypothetical protein PR048_005959 [Dryococelus australis]